MSAFLFHSSSYVRLFVQASPLLCRDLESRLRIDENFVRSLTIKHDQIAPVVVEKRNRHNKVKTNQRTKHGE